MGIFKAYDIRGLVPQELDAELARKIGHAFATLLGAKRLVIGQDMRTHSPEIADAVSEGIRDTGCDVIRLGLASTPMTYFGIGSLECDGGLCVTASHNPGEYNGMKLCREGARPVSRVSGIAEIESMCAHPYLGPDPKRGKEESVDLMAAYARHVVGFAQIDRPLKIAIDAGNGIAGYTLPAILEQLPNVEVHPLYMEIDGSFPNHEANPLVEANLRDVQALVREKGCDFGVAFDGDADRCCFVDENGVTVGADLMTALLAPQFLAQNPGAPIIYDLRSSWVVPEEIKQAGGAPLRERVGHSFIKATMRERGAVFGGELSGHFYFADNYTTDSGVIAMVSVLSLVSSQPGRPFSSMVENLRRYHATGEINFRVPDKEAAIARIKSEFADGQQDELDGITVAYGKLGPEPWWWFNVRASNTEPLLRLNLEASNPELCEQKKAQLVSLLGDPL